MLLLNYFSLISFNNTLIYNECDYLVNIGVFSIQKIRIHPIFLLFRNSSNFYFFCSVMLDPVLYNKYWKFFYSIFQSFFLSSMVGFFNGFRILGRGYKAYLHLNNFLFRLGYSHNIYYTLPLKFKTTIKEKLQSFWIIRGTSKIAISTLISVIRSFKLPNIYRHKGIYRMNDNYNIKLTKKSTL